MANFCFKDILSADPPLITVVDIGAMLEGRSRFDGLIEKRMARVIGFEAEPFEYQKLKALEDEFHRYLPYFIGSGQPGIFHRCRYNGCSSLYRPNPKLIDLFTSIGASANGNFEVLSATAVLTKRLDDIGELGACDFLKVDVQGAELDVLSGARRLLGDTGVVEVEVEFVPLYKDQPLFAEVDIFMRQNGFLLHKLVDVGGRALRPFVLENNPFKAISQLLWSDAVYVKDFTHFDKLSSELLLKMAILLHEVYSSIDLAALAAKAYDAKLGTTLHQQYLSKISGVAKIEHSFMNVKDWI